MARALQVNGRAVQTGGMAATTECPGCCGVCAFYWRASHCPPQECFIYVCADAKCENGEPIKDGTVIDYGGRCYTVSDAVKYVKDPGDGSEPPPGFTFLPPDAELDEDHPVVCKASCADCAPSNCPCNWYWPVIGCGLPTDGDDPQNCVSDRNKCLYNAFVNCQAVCGDGTRVRSGRTLFFDFFGNRCGRVNEFSRWLVNPHDGSPPPPGYHFLPPDATIVRGESELKVVCVGDCETSPLCTTGCVDDGPCCFSYDFAQSQRNWKLDFDGICKPDRLTEIRRWGRSNGTQCFGCRLLVRVTDLRTGAVISETNQPGFAPFYACGDPVRPAVAFFGAFGTIPYCVIEDHDGQNIYTHPFEFGLCSGSCESILDRYWNGGYIKIRALAISWTGSATRNGGKLSLLATAYNPTPDHPCYKGRTDVYTFKGWWAATPGMCVGGNEDPPDYPPDGPGTVPSDPLGPVGPGGRPGGVGGRAGGCSGCGHDGGL